MSHRTHRTHTSHTNQYEYLINVYGIYFHLFFIITSINTSRSIFSTSRHRKFSCYSFLLSFLWISRTGFSTIIPTARRFSSKILLQRGKSNSQRSRSFRHSPRLGPQSPLQDKLLRISVVCPQNGTDCSSRIFFQENAHARMYGLGETRTHKIDVIIHVDTRTTYCQATADSAFDVPYNIRTMVASSHKFWLADINLSIFLNKSRNFHSLIHEVWGVRRQTEEVLVRGLHTVRGLAIWEKDSLRVLLF